MRRLLLLTVCCLGTLGCVVEQLRDDQDKIRLTLLDLYTDQLMDNLIRASNGLPFIHLDYGTAQATVQSIDTTVDSDTYAKTIAHAVTTAATATMMRTRMAVNTFMGSANHDNKEVVAVTATPLTTSVDAYNAYLQFLALPGDPLRCGPTPPPEGTAHICRKWGKLYYWVPIEFQTDFYNLALATTADRGRLLVTPKYFYVTVKGIVPTERPADPNSSVTLLLDSELPNGTGTITFNDGTTASFGLYQSNTTNFLMTRSIVISSQGLPFQMPNGDALAAFLKQNPSPAKVTVDRVQPPAPTTSQLLDQISFNPPQVYLPTQASFSPAPIKAE